MLKKLMIGAGFGAGYVLGSKAGKQRYQQIVDQFNTFMGRPAVREATDTLKVTVTELADTAKATATDTVNAATGAAKDKVSAGGADAPYPAPAVAGLAPSMSAPDTTR